MEWLYQEDNLAARALRLEYADSVERLVAKRRGQADAVRQAYTQEILRDPEKARARFVQMLGWPLTEYMSQKPLQVRSTLIFSSDEMNILRVQLELWEDFWFGGLLFLHPDGCKRPFVLSQHGGAGTPELCSGLLEMGSVNYNRMTQRIFDMGANVFAPQLLLWQIDLFGDDPQNPRGDTGVFRRAQDVSLKNLGGSIMALELTCLRRVLDYFEDMPYVKPGAIGMVGLSYGGQYALLFPAVEPRVQASLSSCYFNDRHTVEWSDYTWFGAGEMFFDEQIALLSRSRRLWIQAATNDEIFSAEGAQRAWERLKELSADDLSWVDFRLFEGVHELDKDDGQLQALMDVLINK